MTRGYPQGAAVDQLQMHLLGDDGSYRIETVCFDREGRTLDVPEGGRPC